MANAGQYGNAEGFLQDIATTVTGLLSDLSAAANGAWRTLSIDNITITGITAPTSAVLTSTSVDVRGAASVTCLFDITGATTGVVINVLGGVSGFAMVSLRSVTASAGVQGFRLGNATTGGTQDTTGISRVDNLSLQVSLSANTGAGTGVAAITVRSRFLTQPSS